MSIRPTINTIKRMIKGNAKQNGTTVEIQLSLQEYIELERLLNELKEKEGN